MLFADAKGFSALTEPQIPAFVHQFLGAVAEQLSLASRPPLLTNTWGDGLYFVFDNARDAGLVALDLAEKIAATDWSAWDLPREMSLRTGLHAGPAYACTDPVTGRLNYLGAHVSRAARIEPIVPPGEGLRQPRVRGHRPSGARRRVSLRIRRHVPRSQRASAMRRRTWCAVIDWPQDAVPPSNRTPAGPRAARARGVARLSASQFDLRGT